MKLSVDYTQMEMRKESKFVTKNITWNTRQAVMEEIRGKITMRPAENK